MHTLMVTLRASDGPAAIAHLVEPERNHATSNTVIVDGVRSDEIAFFDRQLCTTKMTESTASKDTRTIWRNIKITHASPQTVIQKFTNGSQIKSEKYSMVVDSNHDGYRRTGQTITILQPLVYLPYCNSVLNQYAAMPE